MSGSLGSHQLPVCRHCRISWACASSLTHHQVLSCILPTTSCTNLGWGLPDLPGSFLGAQWVLHNKAGVRAAAGLCPRGGALGADAGGLGATFPSSPSGHSLQQHHGVLCFSPCKEQRGCRSPHPPGNSAAHGAFIFKALPASSFILTPPQRLGGLCYRLPISQPWGCSQTLGCFAGAGAEQSPAACLAQCWGSAEGNPAAGLCQDLPGANLPPAASAGPCTGTAWHHMARHGTALMLCNTHWDAMPIMLLSLAGKRLLGVCPSSFPTHLKTATHTASKALKFNKTDCITVTFLQLTHQEKQ